MNLRLFSLAATLILVGIQPAQARQPGFVDHARVTHVEPIVRQVRVETPRRECWDESVEVYHPGRGRHDSATPMILGGIIGGVVGNQFGKGHGRDAATVAGALLGGTLGRDIGQRPTPHGGYYSTETETRCETYTDTRIEERIEGYRVTYRYRGEEFTTRTAEDPGKRIRIRVGVHPLP